MEVGVRVTSENYDSINEIGKRISEARRRIESEHRATPASERRAAVESIKLLMERSDQERKYQKDAKSAEARSNLIMGIKRLVPKRAKPKRKGCVKPMCPHKAIEGEELCQRCKSHQKRT